MPAKYYVTYVRRMCLSNARIEQTNVPPQRLSRRRCGLLPNYSKHLLILAEVIAIR